MASIMTTDQARRHLNCGGIPSAPKCVILGSDLPRNDQIFVNSTTGEAGWSVSGPFWRSLPNSYLGT